MSRNSSSWKSSSSACLGVFVTEDVVEVDGRWGNIAGTSEGAPRMRFFDDALLF